MIGVVAQSDLATIEEHYKQDEEDYREEQRKELKVEIRTSC